MTTYISIVIALTGAAVLVMHYQYSQKTEKPSRLQLQEARVLGIADPGRFNEAELKEMVQYLRSKNASRSGMSARMLSH